MRQVGFVFATLVIALMATGAVAQNVGDNSVFFVSYFSNNTTAYPDEVVRFINDGDQGTGASGDLWAAFYVFDDSQELSECCACEVTPDGLLSEDVATELTANPLTGKVDTRGVIKVISSASSSAADPEPTPGLRGWATHVQTATPSALTRTRTKGGGGAAATATMTESAFSDANLGQGEQTLLGELCYFAVYLGSGQAVCSCTPEDSDF
jgi:hypothetical protein